MTLIYDTAVDSGGNIAVIADKDGDVETGEGVLYVNGSKVYDSDSMLSGLKNNGGHFQFTENGALKQVNEYGPAVTIAQISEDAGNIALLENGGRRAAVFEVQNGLSSNLYASFYQNGAWTYPVAITGHDEKIRSYDALLDDDGNVVVSEVLADVSMDSEGAVTDIARLVYSKTEPIEDIAVDYIGTDDGIKRGERAEFKINVINNTKSAIESVNVTLSGNKSGEIYFGDVNVNIEAGESELITVGVNIPESFEKQTITAQVNALEISERNTENNSVSAVFGQVDLSVDVIGYSIFSDGFAYAVITNNGCEAAEEVTVTVTGENGVEILTENAGTVAAGEKKRIKIELDDKYYTFTDAEDSFAFTVIAECDNEDAQSGEYTYRIYPQTAEIVSVDVNSVGLETGDKYKAAVRVYPQTVTDAQIYMTTSDSSVAAVDKDGTITAVGEGEATIAYMTPGAVIPGSLRVYVHDKGTPQITEIKYSKSTSGGFLSLNIDTSSCLAVGETEGLIIAVYAEDNSLAAISSSQVSADGNIQKVMNVYGEKPKYVKVMLWNSTENMRPTAYAAQCEID